MKRNKKLAVSVISFALAFTCLIGGTYAWYVVSNTAQANFTGKTAQASEGLSLGLVATTGSFAADADATWMDGTIPLNLNGRAPSKGFYPVTSGSYVDGSDINLYRAPEYLKPNNQTPVTPSEGYAEFELVFKSKKLDAAIYLDEAITSFTDSNQNESVLKSLRIGFESLDAKTIFSPHPSRGLTESTNVGGRLDLNGDGVWDYDYDLANHEDKYAEVIYGEVEDGYTYTLTEPTGARTPVPYSNTDVFNAKSVKNNQYQKGTEYVESCTAKTQVSHGSKYYVHNATDTTANHPLVKTSKKIGDYYYGFLNVTIWLEGWDPTCLVDRTAKQEFSYNFGFVAPELVSADGQQF